MIALRILKSRRRNHLSCILSPLSPKHPRVHSWRCSSLACRDGLPPTEAHTAYHTCRGSPETQERLHLCSRPCPWRPAPRATWSWDPAPLPDRTPLRIPSSLPRNPPPIELLRDRLNPWGVCTSRVRSTSADGWRGSVPRVWGSGPGVVRNPASLAGQPIWA